MSSLPPDLPPLPALNLDKPVQNKRSVDPITTNDGRLFAPVVAGNLRGYYDPVKNQITSDGRDYTPTAFETAGGKGSNRKWRASIRILLPDGSIGCSIGYWLFTHGLQHLVPSRSNESKGFDFESHGSVDAQEECNQQQQQQQDMRRNEVRLTSCEHHTPVKQQRRSLQHSSPNKIERQFQMNLSLETSPPKPGNTATVSSGQNVFTDDIASSILASLQKQMHDESQSFAGKVKDDNNNNKNHTEITAQYAMMTMMARPQTKTISFEQQHQEKLQLERDLKAFSVEPTLIQEVKSLALPPRITSPGASADLQQVFDYGDCNTLLGMVTKHKTDQSTPIPNPSSQGDALSPLLDLFPPLQDNPSDIKRHHHRNIITIHADDQIPHYDNIYKSNNNTDTVIKDEDIFFAADNDHSSNNNNSLFIFDTLSKYPDAAHSTTLQNRESSPVMLPIITSFESVLSEDEKKKKNAVLIRKNKMACSVGSNVVFLPSSFHDDTDLH